MCIRDSDGHRLRREVAALQRLDDLTRLREEDPFTGDWARALCPRPLIASRSRFEVDLNRPRERAVYRTPEDAWGLDVWLCEPPREIVERSLGIYDRFYRAAEGAVERLLGIHGVCIIFDLHTYNHRRAGPDAPPADQEGNPDINLGLAGARDARWQPLVARFIREASATAPGDAPLDVRADVNFQGGWFVRHLAARYPGKVCALAIEVKKTFMDEWTGRAEPQALKAIETTLLSAASGVLEELDRVRASL